MARKTKNGPQVDSKTETKTEKIGRKIVKTITRVEITDSVLQWSDILAAATIEPDDLSDAPWDDCEGWEHVVRRPGDYDYADTQEMRGETWSDGRRERIVIELDDNAPASCTPLDGWGAGNYGASKQVNAETIACVRRQALDQLVKWYSRGWSVWQVSCEYLDAHDSLGGIFDDNGDYAEECREDCARNVAHELELDGYKIEGLPEPERRIAGRTLAAWKDAFRRRLHSQDWQHDISRKRRRK